MDTKSADDLVRSGREALAQADWERARSCFEQARELAESAEVLDGLSAAAHFQGEHQEAIQLKERAFAAYRRGGKRAKAAEVARWLAFLYGAVHGNRAAANGWMAWAEGARLGVDDAIALAFGTAKPRPASPAGLSARELEVAGLVAEGLSNKAIAARLHLSVRTVESHVRHVLAKVGLDNRTQLATWATERVR